VNSHGKYEQSFEHFNGPAALDLNAETVFMNGCPSVSFLCAACIKNVMPSLAS